MEIGFWRRARIATRAFLVVSIRDTPQQLTEGWDFHEIEPDLLFQSQPSGLHRRLSLCSLQCANSKLSHCRLHPMTLGPILTQVKAIAKASSVWQGGIACTGAETHRHRKPS